MNLLLLNIISCGGKDTRSSQPEQEGGKQFERVKRELCKNLNEAISCYKSNDTQAHG